MVPPPHEQSRSLPAPPCVAPAEPPPEDFASFYRASVAPLRRYLARVLGDRNEAEDIAQDAFVKTYEAMSDQPVTKPRSFLFVTARRLAINFRTRRASRMKPTEAGFIEAHAGTSPDAVETLIARQDAEAFEAAVLALPPGCQQVLALRLKHGLSHEEIAKKLGLASSTVGNQLTRAIRLLRAQLPAATSAGAQMPSRDSYRIAQ